MSDVGQREIATALRALAGASALHPRATQRLLLLNRDSVPRAAPEGVIVQPAYAWMLPADDTPGLGGSVERSRTAR